MQHILSFNTVIPNQHSIGFVQTSGYASLIRATRKANTTTVKWLLLMLLQDIHAHVGLMRAGFLKVRWLGYKHEGALHAKIRDPL